MSLLTGFTQYDQALSLALDLINTEADTDITADQVNAWDEEELYNWLELAYDLYWTGERWAPHTPGACRVCGCTDNDCSACIKRTGEPCFWVEADLCSACAGVSASDIRYVVTP